MVHLYFSRPLRLYYISSMATTHTFLDYLFTRNGMQFYGAWLLLPIFFLFAANSQIPPWQAVSQLPLSAWGEISIIEIVILLMLYGHYRISKWYASRPRRRSQKRRVTSEVGD